MVSQHVIDQDLQGPGGQQLGSATQRDQHAEQGRQRPIRLQVAQHPRKIFEHYLVGLSLRGDDCACWYLACSFTLRIARAASARTSGLRSRSAACSDDIAPGRVPPTAGMAYAAASRI